MMVCFVSEQKPLSIQAKGVSGFKRRLKDEFMKYISLFPDLPISDSIYSKIIYIHLNSSDIDVDNMSKPFVDTFKGIIYPDDDIVNHRVCSKVKFDDLDAYELQIDLLPIEIAEKLDELLINRSPHIVYYEIGAFAPSMVFFGGIKNEA